MHALFSAYPTARFFIRWWLFMALHKLCIEFTDSRWKGREDSPDTPNTPSADLEG
jgi:hypothetical protein